MDNQQPDGHEPNVDVIIEKLERELEIIKNKTIKEREIYADCVAFRNKIEAIDF
jgi:hypothetical protein